MNLKEYYIKKANHLLEEDTLTEEELINEGLKEILQSVSGKTKQIFGSLKDNAKKYISKFKDSADLLAIKALNSVASVKEFIAKHPKLIFLVFAAMIAGFLVFPQSAHAATVTPDQIADLAKDFPFQLTGEGSNLKLIADATSTDFADFASKLVQISLEGNDPVNAISDLHNNVGEVVQKFLMDNKGFVDLMNTNKELAKSTFTEIYGHVFTNLQKLLFPIT